MTILPIVAPPPYSPFSTSRVATTVTEGISDKRSLINLPEEILLRILNELSLIELNFTMKFINKQFNLLSVHSIQSKLLPSYYSKLKYGGLDSMGFMGTRETLVLNQYSTLTCQTLKSRAESSLILNSEESSSTVEKDLFNLFQPQAKLEDLILYLAKSNQLIDSSSTQVLEEDVTVELTSKKVKLLLPFESLSERGRIVVKGVVELKRIESESLEGLAQRIVFSLSQVGLSRNPKGWYVRC